MNPQPSSPLTGTAPGLLPPYLSIPAGELGAGTAVKVRVAGDQNDLAQTLASDMLAEIAAARREGRRATFIIPVGPVDQYPILAERLNRERISCRDVVFIGMDEYLGENCRWIPAEHPLSFRGYLARKFYDLLDPEVAPPPGQRVFPDPDRPQAIQEVIASRGGVDVCYGGIGITGHIAFNEPPEPGEEMAVEAFAALPTRVLPLARETRTINSVTVGGEISIIPRQAVTVGMKEILGARRLRLYCNRPWQSSVVRRVLHGPVTAACPASLMRTHPDAMLTLAEYVAAPPDIRLR